MIENETVVGQQTAWTFINKLGEGDAGEVYLVTSAAGGQVAILKRPRPSAFSGEMFRQSGQIRAEGKILRALAAGLSAAPLEGVSVPALLDVSKPEADFNARNFIVIERAAGLDLGALARVAQLGLNAADNPAAENDAAGRALVQLIAQNGRVPKRIVLIVLGRLLDLLERIHGLPNPENGAGSGGVIWNDVKPEHLYWEPSRQALTVIDWGNARFLEADGATSDRKFSWADDFRQLFDEMGRYLTIAAPELPEALHWPCGLGGEAGPAELAALRAQLASALQRELEGLAQARALETSLLQSGDAAELTLADLEGVQLSIQEYGELPDYPAAVRFAAGFAAGLAGQDRLEELRKLCQWVAGLPPRGPWPGGAGESWRVVDFLARLPGKSQGEQRACFLEAIQAAIGGDWENTLWKIVPAIAGYPEPDWWHDLTLQLRRLSLLPEAQGVRPLVAARRLNLALQSTIWRYEDQAGRAGSSLELDLRLEPLRLLARRLKEEVITPWAALDPGPPDSGLDYGGVEALLAELAGSLPGECAAVTLALQAPKTQVKRVLEAWKRQEFAAARAGLRRVLLADPDRWRVLRAEQALAAAAEFLQNVRLGPPPRQGFPQWITNLELQGRELRNQVGPAGWLDGLLDSLRQIRRGAWPADLLRANPALPAELPWLARFERIPDAQRDDYAVIQGDSDGWLGPEGSLALVEPLDAWKPEARGSSARVVLGRLMGPDAVRREAAIKLMRMDQVHYALPLFREEALVLPMLRDVPGVSRLLECGFILLDEDRQFPLTSADEAPPAVGRVQRIGPQEAALFIERLEGQIGEGWTPYLAIEKQEQADSLLMLCDAGMTRGQYLPVLTLLQMSIQICEIMQAAHARNIVYRDHKILHYYWQEQNNALYSIDWNVARYHPDGLAQHEIEMDLVQFGARGLHHILTGRTAPGALPLGPTRPEEIDQAAETYQTQWTYDDQRLPESLRQVLERVLAGGYHSAAALGEDLKATLMHIPDVTLPPAAAGAGS